MEERDKQLWRIAKKRAGFKKHLASYIIVNGFLWAMCITIREPLPGSIPLKRSVALEPTFSMSVSWPPIFQIQINQHSSRQKEQRPNLIRLHKVVHQHQQVDQDETQDSRHEGAASVRIGGAVVDALAL